MKILFISSQFYPTLGGIPTISQYLIEYFIKQKNNTILITKTEMTKYEKKLFNFVICSNPSRKKINELHEWADIVFHNNICLSLSSIRLKYFKKTIVTSQYWLGRKFSFRYLIKKIFLKLSAQNIFISKSIKEHINISGKIIPNFYNEKLFYNIKPFSLRKRKIIFVGRTTDEKGVDIFIRSIKLIEKKLNKGDVTIVGIGNKLNEYKKLTKKLKIFNLFNFVKKKNNELNKYYNNHRIHVVPSKKEPFGIVTLEGCASGCIGVLSNMYGLSEFNKKIFQFYNNNDFVKLAYLLKKNIIKPKIINNNIKKKYLSKFHLDIIANKYLAIFNKFKKNNND